MTLDELISNLQELRRHVSGEMEVRYDAPHGDRDQSYTETVTSVKVEQLGRGTRVFLS